MPQLLIANIIGWLATIAGTCLMLPQIIKAYRTRKMKDVSSGMVVLYIANCVLWLTYGFLIGAFQVAIANSLGLIIGIVQLSLKQKFG
jgi:MtN3 and saliva related transmembrane protein